MRFHRVPRSMISDRDYQIYQQFLEELMGGTKNTIEF